VGPPQRPRPDQTIPCIREWLVAGPFPGVKKEDDFLHTPHLNPKRTTPVKSGPAGKRKWERHLSAEDKVDFKNSVGSNAWASFYAAVYIHSDEERGAVVWLGSDDGLRAYMNGKQVLFGHHHGYCGDDFYRVPVHLKKGRNLLLLHIENLEYHVHFKAKLSDPEGKPVDGLIFSTSPRTPRR
jgi:hypothetical protein